MKHHTSKLAYPTHPYCLLKQVKAYDNSTHSYCLLKQVKAYDNSTYPYCLLKQVKAYDNFTHPYCLLKQVKAYDNSTHPYCLLKQVKAYDKTRTAAERALEAKEWIEAESTFIKGLNVSRASVCFLTGAGKGPMLAPGCAYAFLCTTQEWHHVHVPAL